MCLPVVTIVGRVNVGKSALFNRLTGKRIAITSSVAGTTRDAVNGLVVWCGKKFKLIDTGGFCIEPTDAVYSQTINQVTYSLKKSDVVIFVVNVKEGLTGLDEEIAFLIKKSQKSVVLCVNKCDTVGCKSLNLYEFYALGFGEPISVSAVHGHGTGDLLDAVCSLIDFSKFSNSDDKGGNVDASIKVAVVGRPNAGKSSLVNKVFDEERCIVTDLPGTTRDSLDVNLNNNFGSYTFIDTAGIRKRKKIDDNLEKYSVLRSKMAIERSDVCLLMLDVTSGYSEQDSKIVEFIQNSGKGLIIVANKWDLVEKDMHTMEIYKNRLAADFSFAKYSPITFMSAKTGQKINDIFPLINSVNLSCQYRVSTSTLNNFLAETIAKVPLPTHKGKKLKIFYITQASTSPPTFVFFVNSEKLFHFSYQRYIENQLRGNFNLVGAPVRFIIREKVKDNIRV